VSVATSVYWYRAARRVEICIPAQAEVDRHAGDVGTAFFQPLDDLSPRHCARRGDSVIDGRHSASH
jgi:hypothetical protein